MYINFAILGGIVSSVMSKMIVASAVW
jgi:hypothetical protein